MSSPAISLSVAYYNKPDRLRLVLAGCARQTFRDFEVVVADDGSGPESREIIAAARERYGYPIVHLWHEDRGWRKNAMLNNAIRAARSPQVVFIDGDCIPARHFLHDHHSQFEPGSMLLGRRVETGERWSSALTLEDVESGRYERLGWQEIRDGLAGRSLRVEDGIRIPSRLIRTVLLRRVNGMLGSNFSAAKTDLEAVNGFDELYTGPGCGEDSDIEYRLSLTGIRRKSLRNLAILYHLYHPATPTSQASWDRFQQVKAAGQARCSSGLQSL